MAEILIHERFEQNQRGLKAFSVTIAPKGDGAAVAAQNLKMPPETGKQMTADAYRWAKGNVGCKEGETDWAPVAAAPVPEPKKPVPKKPIPKKIVAQPKPAESSPAAKAAKTE